MGCMTESKVWEVRAQRADSEKLLTVIMVTCKQAEGMKTSSPQGLC